MQPRRSLRLVAGALVLAVPLLSSCGFDYATDRPYTPAAGTNARDSEGVEVLAAVVVAAQPGSGTFIATLSNTSTTDAASFEALTGAGETQVVPDEVEPVEIPARGYVDLSDDGGVPLTGDFGAGDFLPLTLEFGSGDSVTLEVPVVFACQEYAGLDISTDQPTEEATEGTGEVVVTGEPYDCEFTDTAHEE